MGLQNTINITQMPTNYQNILLKLIKVGFQFAKFNGHGARQS